MRLPYMKAPAKKSRKQIIRFGGVNYSQDYGDGELLESLGLSSEQFPCMSQRAGRKTAGTYISPTGLYARGELCVVDGDSFLYGGRAVGHVTPGEKQFATINTKIVIFPDKVYYDTSEDKFGSLEASYPFFPGDATFTENTVTVPQQSYIDLSGDDTPTISFPDGAAAITVYTGASIDKNSGALTLSGGAAKTVAELEAGDIIQHECDSDKEYMVVKSCAGQSDDSYQVSYTLHAATLHSYPVFEDVFTAGDAIELSGCTSLPGNNGSHIVRSISGRTMTFDSNIFSAGAEAGTVMAERRVPDLSCICECDNRIWGAEGTTIWASALGDPKNFHVYDGLETDSYFVPVGSDGDFTGCIAYSGTVLFWKEHCVHKIMGKTPREYSYNTYTVQGLQAGSEKSMVIINETLFYKGRNGVYAYTGSTPELLTERFGSRRFTNGVAGSDGQRYYISMQTERGSWELYVFDTLRGIWLREDELHAADWAYLDGTLYFLDADTGKVMATSQDRSEEGRITWSATLCPFTEAGNNEKINARKGYSRLFLRAELEAGAWIKAEISADGAPWHQVFTTHNERARVVQIPILPTRCDSFRVRLSGKGECVIKSFTREFSVGSEY